MKLKILLFIAQKEKIDLIMFYPDIRYLSFVLDVLFRFEEKDWKPILKPLPPSNTSFFNIFALLKVNALCLYIPIHTITWVQAKLVEELKTI